MKPIIGYVTAAAVAAIIGCSGGYVANDLQHKYIEGNSGLAAVTARMEGIEKGVTGISSKLEEHLDRDIPAVDAKGKKIPVDPYHYERAAHTDNLISKIADQVNAIYQQRPQTTSR